MRPLKAGLIYFLLIFALGWVLGPIRNSGGAEVRSHGGPARQSCHHADSDDRLITLGDAPFQRAPYSRLDYPNGSGGARNIDTRRDRGCLWVRGLSLQEYSASFVTAPSGISAVMFLLFSAMPSLGALLTRRRGGTIS